VIRKLSAVFSVDRKTYMEFLKTCEKKDLDKNLMAEEWMKSIIKKFKR